MSKHPDVWSNWSPTSKTQGVWSCLQWLLLFLYSFAFQWYSCMVLLNISQRAEVVCPWQAQKLCKQKLVMGRARQIKLSVQERTPSVAFSVSIRMEIKSIANIFCWHVLKYWYCSHFSPENTRYKGPLINLMTLVWSQWWAFNRLCLWTVMHLDKLN